MHEHKSLNYQDFANIFSAKTLDYHHGKHHKTYVDKLNSLIAGSDYEALTLEEIIIRSHQKDTAIYNNAAQVWNHNFFWQSLTNQNAQHAQIMSLISDNFGDLATFKQKFTEAGMSVFGSGWIWLVSDKNNKLSIFKASNADNPLITDKKALLTLDVWEHAYYIEHFNSRIGYLEKMMLHLNWQFAEDNLNK
jgi:Fe-Mn family superoxide dismutase